jgi:uncharacterized protein YjiS (DUF1127 family)
MANMLLHRRRAEDRSVGFGIAARLLGGLACALQRARQRRALALLSDALLRDIGVTRQEVQAECHKPFWRP